MTTLTNYLLFSAVAVLVAFNFHAQESTASDDPLFRYSMNPSSIEAGERATLEFRLPKQEGSAFTPKVNDSLFVQATPFILLHTEAKEEKGDYVWNYDLTSYKTGEFTLPPIQVQYGPNTYSTERTPLTVTSTRPPEDETLREDFPKMWPSPPWKTILMYGVALLFFGIALPYVYRKIQRIPWRKWKERQNKPKPEPRIDPLVWLKRELKRLRSQVEQEDFNAGLVDDLTTVLRKYLYLQYQEPFPNRTTREFKQTLQRYSNLSPLLDPFQKLDHYKFSPFKRDYTKDLILDGILVAENTLCGT